MAKQEPDFTQTCVCTGINDLNSVEKLLTGGIRLAPRAFQALRVSLLSGRQKEKNTTFTCEYITKSKDLSRSILNHEEVYRVPPEVVFLLSLQIIHREEFGEIKRILKDHEISGLVVSHNVTKMQIDGRGPWVRIFLALTFADKNPWLVGLLPKDIKGYGDQGMKLGFMSLSSH